jgi:hypothetical protein
MISISAKSWLKKRKSFSTDLIYNTRYTYWRIGHHPSFYATARKRFAYSVYRQVPGVGLTNGCTIDGSSSGTVVCCERELFPRPMIFNHDNASKVYMRANAPAVNTFHSSYSRASANHRLCVIYFRSSGSSKISAVPLSLIISPIGYLLLHYYRAATDCITAINYALRESFYLYSTVDASRLTPDWGSMWISKIPSNPVEKADGQKWWLYTPRA